MMIIFAMFFLFFRDIFQSILTLKKTSDGLKTEAGQKMITTFIDGNVESIKKLSMNNDKLHGVMKTIQFHGIAKNSFDVKRKRLHDKIDTLLKQKKDT